MANINIPFAVQAYINATINATEIRFAETMASMRKEFTQTLAQRDLQWETALSSTIDSVASNSRDMDIAWLVTCGALVFFMQAGFAMLEAGIVHPKNVANILFKNMIDASIAAVCFWLLGYGFAYGDDRGGFIGGTNFGCEDIYNGAGAAALESDGWEGWFFQWAFAGACATIVAGSVAERTKLEAYFIYSVVLTTFLSHRRALGLGRGVPLCVGSIPRFGWGRATDFQEE